MGQRAPTSAAWRSRIVAEADVDPRTLTAHPQNWRLHPPGQREALGQVLDEVGWVTRAVVSRQTGRLLDGHLRVELAVERGEITVPVTYVDVSEDEERLILTSLDPIAALAKTNQEKLAALVAQLGERRADLVAQLQISKGFRAGSGFLKDGKTDWKTEDTFYSMPDWLAPKWEAASDVVVEFSGGKDSTAAALWAAKHAEGKHIVLAFVDPGVEFPGMSAHVADVARFLKLDYAILRPPPKLDWWVWIAENGWPSILHRPCAMDFIHKPWAAFVRTKPPGNTIVITGSRAEEANRGSTKSEQSPLDSLGKHAKDYQHFAPCFSAQKDLLGRLITESHVPLWEGYEQGFVRTACWCCPGQCGLQAAALQRNYPGLADTIRRWEKRVGPMQPLNKGSGANGGKTFDDLMKTGQQKEARCRAEEVSKTSAPPNANA
jgi:3'-phosphoadenosine 5'-phosphosulfate sulfotransferase (PAPS reductase)/FAD synthetase